MIPVNENESRNFSTESKPIAPNIHDTILLTASKNPPTTISKAPLENSTIPPMISPFANLSKDLVIPPYKPIMMFNGNANLEKNPAVLEINPPNFPTQPIILPNHLEIEAIFSPIKLILPIALMPVVTIVPSFWIAIKKSLIPSTTLVEAAANLPAPVNIDAKPLNALITGCMLVIIAFLAIINPLRILFLKKSLTMFKPYSIAMPSLVTISEKNVETFAMLLFIDNFKDSGSRLNRNLLRFLNAVNMPPRIALTPMYHDFNRPAAAANMPPIINAHLPKPISNGSSTFSAF